MYENLISQIGGKMRSSHISCVPFLPMRPTELPTLMLQSGEPLPFLTHSPLLCAFQSS